METEREKYFPGEALPGLLDTESCEPDRLRSSASPGTLVGMEQGLRVVCIFTKAGQEVRFKKKNKNKNKKNRMI